MGVCASRLRLIFPRSNVSVSRSRSCLLAKKSTCRCCSSSTRTCSTTQCAATLTTSCCHIRSSGKFPSSSPLSCVLSMSIGRGETRVEIWSQTQTRTPCSSPKALTRSSTRQRRRRSCTEKYSGWHLISYTPTPSPLHTLSGLEAPSRPPSVEHSTANFVRYYKQVYFILCS
jgi:hypothetical protein